MVIEREGAGPGTRIKVTLGNGAVIEGIEGNTHDSLLVGARYPYTLLSIASIQYDDNRHTVLLGNDGNFEELGDPETGHVYYRPVPPGGGRVCGGFGDRAYWRGHVARYRLDERRVFTEAGLTW